MAVALSPSLAAVALGRAVTVACGYVGFAVASFVAGGLPTSAVVAGQIAVVLQSSLAAVASFAAGASPTSALAA